MELDFGLYLHSLRKKNHLTQNQMAQLIGVSYQAISNWERNVTLPDVQLILPLSKIFNVPAKRILYMMCGEFESKSIDEYLAKRKEQKNEKNRNTGNA